ncbi:MAG: DUF4433 domain-containing protein [Chloroflexi bacterium]|nr:DUF4433 domain-containing protein [Chloroflexota bacterium]
MTELYHITHIGNLPSILGHGGLWCDNSRVEKGLATRGIAHDHIKVRRAQRVVPLGAGGTLADYVPFYFAPRSPMLYAIHTGYVVGYNEGQEPIVHLVSSADKVVRSQMPFSFTDGHAEMAISSFFDSLADLNRIDWDIMQTAYWRDTSLDGDRKRKRQAEFLVYRFFPWSLVTEIGVISSAMADRVEAIVTGANHQPNIAVRRSWYY